MYTLNCKGRLLTLPQPIVMGIINVTPDSFYLHSRTFEAPQIIDQAGKMLQEGAVILDIGGQSSRPGAEPIGIEEELNRVIPAIREIRNHFPDAFLSIDTYHAEVAKQAVASGADIINDISSGEIDPEMINTVAALQVPYIAMHMRGTPETMQQQTNYRQLVPEVLDFFQQKIQHLNQQRIYDLILDPGFGFSKTTAQNFELLGMLETFQVFRKPVLVGLSRKSMIWKTVGGTPETALNGTSILHTIALQKGAFILRTHDVKEAMECIVLYQHTQTHSY